MVSHVSASSCSKNVHRTDAHTRTRTHTQTHTFVMKRKKEEGKGCTDGRLIEKAFELAWSMGLVSEIHI